jgi:hypothetical protein
MKQKNNVRKEIKTRKNKNRKAFINKKEKQKE